MRFELNKLEVVLPEAGVKQTPFGVITVWRTFQLGQLLQESLTVDSLLLTKIVWWSRASEGDGVMVRASCVLRNGFSGGTRRSCRVRAHNLFVLLHM